MGGDVALNLTSRVSLGDDTLENSDVPEISVGSSVSDSDALKELQRKIFCSFCITNDFFQKTTEFIQDNIPVGYNSEVISSSVEVLMRDGTVKKYSSLDEGDEAEDNEKNIPVSATLIWTIRLSADRNFVSRDQKISIQFNSEELKGESSHAVLSIHYADNTWASIMDVTMSRYIKNYVEKFNSNLNLYKEREVLFFVIFLFSIINFSFILYILL